MTGDQGQRTAGDQKLWSMGAVSRHTGLSTHTLRAWERRFGFPDPVRLASGHRRYPADQVQRLAVIQSALEQGHRIGDLIHLDEREIASLVGSAGVSESGRETSDETYLEACLRLDSESLASMMHRDASSLGVSRFLSEKIVPFVDEIGRGWENGTISIRHEHMSTEVVETVLRELRTVLARSASGRPVVLATLPEELHGLGLQIVALLLASRGVPVRILGTNTPVEEIVAAATSLDATAVAISITEASVSPQVVDDIAKLRSTLSDGTILMIGGRGATRLDGLPDGVTVVGSLDEVGSVFPLR